jgi:hypothetical protein
MFRAASGPACRPKGQLFVKIIAVQDLDSARGSTCTVTNYVLAVLKVRALGRELNYALREAERHRTVLMSARQADALCAEANALLGQLEAETAADDAASGS